MTQRDRDTAAEFFEELDRSLPPGLCAWPIGDPADPDFRYCREPVGRPGEPYCAAHCARAWRTPGDLAADRAAWLVEQHRRHRQPGRAA